MKAEIKSIDFASEAYQAELALRNEILRKPIGLDLYSEDLSQEHKDCHIGAFIDGELVGCLILTPLGNGEVKMRQVAAREAYQGLGIGRRLVEFSELVAKENKYSAIVLTARKTAVGFYEKLGYRVVGGELMEVGIPHFRMVEEIQ